ncbi:sigma-54-dependent transcriptional regulator [Methylomonas fluvii]|uniref:Sigma-54-dependent Fis family transcriptional regulator n=1 Tax=Methylomonas fluvii TaxID=1854564 RepID=A0ABR9DLI8_9GAMM|nr:sigma-54 dependent transcriptional regulator [Methylomonas fluvii]MBD9363741.1 sigma-54-dependent Fis family transcriptional regulator [Methylomonas fluvii]CAD6877049.1 sigma-54 dependent DNA-binding response regulator [Methylomonas fluvii]
MQCKDLGNLPILLVDDEAQLLHSASLVLRSAGFSEVLTLDDSRTVLPLLANRPIGVIVLDLTMPHLSGRELLEQIAVEYPEIPLIMMTATNDLQIAVACMRSGASDYLLKPVEQNCLVAAVRRAVESRVLRAEFLSLKERMLTNSPHEPSAFADIVTQSPAMFAIFRYIEAIAASPQPVLISGETGAGKELIARALHRLSGRAGDLVAVNVAGLDDTLFSDTLFGHAKGSFTGAERARDGLLASTGDGTLFLDEIGDLSIASQVKLLRLLQDGSFYPIGADRPRQSRARIIVATHCDVRRQVDLGSFRKDLYFRLRTHHIQLPPLRERREDLPQLTLHFVEKAADSLGKPALSVPPALFQWLHNYAFPGNIRELEGMAFDAVARSQGAVLSLQSFKEAIAEHMPSSGEEDLASANLASSGNFPARLPTLKEAEESLISEALKRAQGNQGVAAGLLGISRQALNKRLIRRDAESL